MCKKYGFTLIELLVVVLIVGILAAVALSQYQKVVQKSRNAKLKTLIRSVAQAQQAYYMANGSLSANFSSLDLDLPLFVPKVSAGIGNTCNLITTGPDSIREGEDFQIVLNNFTGGQRGGVAGVWTTGKYKCTGFSMSRLQEGGNFLLCSEAANDKSTVKAGDFCEKIEDGVFLELTSSWRKYSLP